MILQEELMAGEEVATCPSCSLVVKVIYDLVNIGTFIFLSEPRSYTKT